MSQDSVNQITSSIIPSASDLMGHVGTLKSLLVAHATGSNADNKEFVSLREALVKDHRCGKLLPEFIRDCRSLDEFWGLIKYKFPHYRERREYIWKEFTPLLKALERADAHPSDSPVSTALQHLNAAYVESCWHKALERRQGDPEGAITAARTLLETVCKHILDDQQVCYDENLDLPKLYKQAAESLNIAPVQHAEPVFKQILGGCTSVVEGLGALRNRLSDAHGKGVRASRPAPRHAALAVNLAGTMAAFLVETLEHRRQSAGNRGGSPRSD